MLGRFEKVELRDVWKHEAIDFTKWLAEEESINLLSETLGIEIEVVGTEASVGSFNVDILAKDSNSESKIIIENQLERTDHDHLGKIITYASGYEAETIIWIVKGVRDEHRKAVEWLNNHLDEKINLFLVQIEVWRIGDSNPAPKFDIVEGPNNWAKTLKKASNIGSTELSNIQKLQLDFWTKLKEYGEDQFPTLGSRTPRPRRSQTFRMAGGKHHIKTRINSRDESIGITILIYDSQEALFTQFFENKEAIEKELGFPLEWMELPENKSSKIAVYKPFDLNDKESWKETQTWMLEKIVAMKEVFAKYK